MTNPVNLNRARKQKARAESKARADENTLRFGRSKVERQRDGARTNKAKRDLDGHKRDE